MLTREIAEQVDEYLYQMYSPTSEDMEYLEEVDDLILELTINEPTPRDNATIQRVANDLLARMQILFENYSAATPVLIQYQERFYQLQVMYAKANNMQEAYLDSLALLCYTSSFDLYYLQNYKYADKTHSSDDEDILSNII